MTSARSTLGRTRERAVGASTQTPRTVSSVPARTISLSADAPIHVPLSPVRAPSCRRSGDAAESEAATSTSWGAVPVVAGAAVAGDATTG
jgi:hypothetical protein